MSKITAKGKFLGQDVKAEVVNPGDWYGKAWLVYVEDCFDPPLYVVEAESAAEAESEFVSCVESAGVVISTLSAGADDYGWPECDNHGNRSWTTLRGTRVTDPEKGKYIREPSTTDSGLYYDGESIRIEGREAGKVPWPCRYFGEGLPEDGIAAEDYVAWRERDLE